MTERSISLKEDTPSNNEEDIFKQSSELKDTIEKHNWNLYHAVRGVYSPWKEFERTGPAKQFEVGYDYLFVPTPQKDQTLREAYSMTKGLGPSLSIDPKWEGLEDVYHGESTIERGDEILFSRLWFANSDIAFAITPRTDENFDPSAVAIKLTHLVETFDKYFRIVSPADYASQTNIVSA